MIDRDTSRRLLIPICLVFCYGVKGLDDLPTNFPRCSRNDPNMDECLIAATERVRPFIRVGVKDFLPPIENFKVPKIVLSGGNNAINYKAELANLTLQGLENYKFTKYHFDRNDKAFLIDVELPLLHMQGKFILTGKLFFAPLRGNGNFFVNISDTSCSIYHTIEVYSKNGVEYLRPLVTTPTIHVGKVLDYNFDGLFSENKNLEQVTKEVINRNLNVIIEELTPAIQKVMANIFDEVIFKSVTKIPYDKLYPK